VNKLLWTLGLLLTAAACEPLAGIPTRVSNSTGSVNGAAGSGANSVCGQYCQEVNSTCTGQYAVYHGSEDCKAACNLLNDGERACRAREADTAAKIGDDYLHCPAAALGGGDACGGNCTNYCTLMSRVCTGQNRDPQEVEDCERKCKVLVDREDTPLAATQSRYDVEADHEGDTLQCRLVHLTIAAYPGSANDHCWHAALAPRPLVTTDGGSEHRTANPCATAKGATEPGCDDYCHILMGSCTGNDQVYESPEQCKAVCQKLDKGNVLDNAPETVACRKIHAYNALAYALPAVHCPHAGPGGDMVCGDDCNAYCRLLEAGCSDGFKAKFGSGADAAKTCTSACTKQHGSAALRYSVNSAKAKTSNPIACGLLNVARALEKPADAAGFCAAALGGGECQR
jgi:hypothetical protein